MLAVTIVVIIIILRILKDYQVVFDNPHLNLDRFIVLFPSLSKPPRALLSGPGIEASYTQKQYIHCGES